MHALEGITLYTVISYKIYCSTLLHDSALKFPWKETVSFEVKQSNTYNPMLRNPSTKTTNNIYYKLVRWWCHPLEFKKTHRAIVVWHFPIIIKSHRECIHDHIWLNFKIAPSSDRTNTNTADYHTNSGCLWDHLGNIMCQYRGGSQRWTSKVKKDSQLILWNVGMFNWPLWR